MGLLIIFHFKVLNRWMVSAIMSVSMVDTLAVVNRRYKMVAGHLQEKRGYYYIILGYTDQNGKWASKWISTGLKTKGNKKKAEDMLSEARRNFDSDSGTVVTGETACKNATPDDSDEDQGILFTDFMLDWLKMMRNSIEATTLASYQMMIEKQIVPYFRPLNIRLSKLEPKSIQDYYQYMMDTRGVSANTVIHHHANIRKALQYAFKIGLILSNPADKIERPKKQKFVGSFYDGEELNQLFEISKGHKLELAVILGAFYGLRREEVVGLKWSAIDFQSKTITIKHTVTEVTVDGKTQIFEKDRTKNQSSRRTLPLVPQFEALLIELKEKQAHYRDVCKSSYNTEYLDYLCVDEMGNRIKPNWISEAFPRLLVQNNMRRIRFHDLRHP